MNARGSSPAEECDRRRRRAPAAASRIIATPYRRCGCHIYDIGILDASSDDDAEPGR